MHINVYLVHLVSLNVLHQCEKFDMSLRNICLTKNIYTKGRSHNKRGFSDKQCFHHLNSKTKQQLLVMNVLINYLSSICFLVSGTYIYAAKSR